MTLASRGSTVDLFDFQRALLWRQVQLPHLPFDVRLLGAQRPVRQLLLMFDAILKVGLGPVGGEELGDLRLDESLHRLGLAGRDASTRADRM